MPLITGLESIECVRLTTHVELAPELTARITEALSGVPHTIEQVPPGHGIRYRPHSLG
jgi:hypothetical protein